MSNLWAWARYSLALAADALVIAAAFTLGCVAAFLLGLMGYGLPMYESHNFGVRPYMLGASLRRLVRR